MFRVSGGQPSPTVRLEKGIEMKPSKISCRCGAEFMVLKEIAIHWALGHKKPEQKPTPEVETGKENATGN